MYEHLKQYHREELLKLLGELPPRDGEIKVETVWVEERERYHLEKLLLHLNGIEPVPAYFVKPHGTTDKLPAILYNHAHGGKYSLGKDELLLGRDNMQTPAYADVLTRLGYAALSIDMWGFGGRRGKSETELFKEMLLKGQIMWGMMVYDNLRAFDYLVSRSDVDAKRIGTLGISMGSTMAWWSAALETRIKVCVDLCCLADYQALIDSRGLAAHNAYYYVPGLLKHSTTAQINTLIAPRPHLSLAGIYDPLTPPIGLDRIDTELKRVYREEEAGRAWSLLRFAVGHLENPAMRAKVVEWFKHWL